MLSFEDDDGKLGVEEFTTEKEKLEAKQRLKVVRRMVGEEESIPHSSTAASQIAKKLTRLTLGALLADVALSQARDEGEGKQCPAYKAVGVK